jgi:general secretion pathway protein G
MILQKQAQAATRASKRAAFTLMEMLVVVSILVVLAGAAVPIYLNYLANARIDRAKVDVKNLATAVEAYKARDPYDQYPPNLEALTVSNPNTGQKATLEQNALKDPWGNLYQYSPTDIDQNTGKIRVWSQGPPGGPQISSR